MLCRFWEIESEGRDTKSMMTAYEKKPSKVDAGFLRIPGDSFEKRS